MTDWQRIGVLIRAVLRYRIRLAVALICSLFVSLFGVGSIVMLKPVLDLLFQQVETVPPMKYGLENQSIELIVGLPGVDSSGIAISRDGPTVRISAPKRASEDWFGECYLPEKFELESKILDQTEAEEKSLSWMGIGQSRDRLREIFHPVYIWLLRYMQENRLWVLAIAAGVALFFTLLKCVFGFAQLYFSNWIGQRVILDIRERLFHHLLAMDMGFFKARRSGELLSYLTIDVELMGGYVFAVFGEALLEPLIILATLVTLFCLYPLLTTVYLLLLPLTVLIVAILGERIRKARASTQGALGSMNALLQETFSAMPIIKAFRMQDERKRKFSTENRKIFRSVMRIIKTRGVSTSLTETLGAIGVLGVLLLGGYFVFQHGMEATSFLVYIFMLANLYHPIKRLNKSYNTIQQGMAGMDRIFGILDLESQISDRPDARNLSEFKREILFDRVCFSYDGKTPVLTDISFAVPHGKVVALVGPSGAGKSTLVSLIPRFHDPTSGGISVDGCDLRTLTLDSLRAKIGLVPQETLLFSDTLKVNIACGNDKYPWERVETAAKDAQVDGFARELPEGYDTVIGERGCTLSGGQAQRVAIARALLKDPPILILDEATSSLDSESELLIREALDRLMENRTVFVIAHRLSTILHADMILVLDNGRIADIGNHSELLQRCPLYQRLYELQFASARAVENFETT